MSQTRPVPGIARGPQGFSQRNLPPIPNPMGQPPMQYPPAADVSIEDELAMEIYSKLAIDHIRSNHGSGSVDLLRDAALAAKAAASAFFEEQPTNG